MNLILLTDEDREADGGFRITGRRALHIREVLNAHPGDRLRVGLLEGSLGKGAVRVFDGDAVFLDCEFEASPPPRPTVDLLLAVPRPKTLMKLLPQVAALGVDRLVLMRTWRVGKPYLTARVLEPEVYRPLLHEGLMQARCTREPRVLVEPLFRPFVEDRAAELFADRRKLLAHPTAPTALSGLSFGAAERVALAIGPEGGFIPFEVEMLAEAGFEPVHLGPRPLRVETACVALLSAVSVLRAG